MAHRIYFVEGIPGSGKTTQAKKIKEILTQKGNRVVCIEECEKNPLDLARCAILTEQEYSHLKEKVAKGMNLDEKEVKTQLQMLENVSEYADGAVYVFFQSLFAQKELQGLALSLRSRDVYNGHYSFQFFRKAHLKRWRKFSHSISEDDTVYICDAVLLQSPLFELMGYYDFTEGEIIQYIEELLVCVRDMSPMICYNYVHDVPSAMKNTCLYRKKENDRWEQGFYKWMERSPYCQKHNYHGFDGMCEFLQERQALECRILRKLKVPVEYLDTT